METYISIAFRLINAYAKTPIQGNEVQFTLDGESIHPVYKQGGYFLFTNLAEGEREVVIHSPFFQSLKVVCAVPKAGEGYTLYHKLLNPKATYKIGREMTAIKGTFIGEKAQASKLYLLPDDKAIFKVAQEHTSEGDKEVKLYALIGKREIHIPGQYMLADKKQQHQQLCMLIEEREDRYVLEEPIGGQYTRGSTMHLALEVNKEPNGAFYIAFAPDNEEVIHAKLMGVHPTGEIKEVAIQVTKGKVAQVGTITW